MSVSASSTERCHQGAYSYSCNNTVDASGIEYNSDLIEGKSEVTTWRKIKPASRGTRETDSGSAPIGIGQRFDEILRANADGGSSATARLSTFAEQSVDEFLLEGVFQVRAAAASGQGWGGMAGANVDFMVSLTIGASSNLYVENCERFEITGTMKETSLQGSDCVFTSEMGKDAFSILMGTDYSQYKNIFSESELAALKKFPVGDWIILILRPASAPRQLASISKLDLVARRP